MTDDFLSVRDLAKQYKMTEKTIKKLIADHQLPHQVVKAKTMVNVRAFDAWMAANIKTLDEKKLESIESDEKNRAIKIAPMIKEEHLVFNPPDLTKKDILKRLVETMVIAGDIDPKKGFKAIFKAVIERERLCSTAISDGVAIPHPRSSMEEYISEPALILGISPRGIDFESDDGKKTNLFFLISAPRTDIHLKVMARLSRLLRSAKFRHELIISKTYDEVVDVFKKWEKTL